MGAAPSGTATAGLVAGGGTATTDTAATEEWNANFGYGVWVTGGTMNTARDSLGGVGTQTAALAFAGAPPGVTGATESYNGTAWAELNDINTARRVIGSQELKQQL
jgi:hypothetical protein